MQATREYVSGPQAISIQWRRDKRTINGIAGRARTSQLKCPSIEQIARFVIGFCMRTGRIGAQIDHGTGWE
jgi:hypothetical protein